MSYKSCVKSVWLPWLPSMFSVWSQRLKLWVIKIGFCVASPCRLAAPGFAFRMSRRQHSFNSDLTDGSRWLDLASGACSRRCGTMQSSWRCRGAGPWHRDASYVLDPDPWNTGACLLGRKRWSQGRRKQLAGEGRRAERAERRGKSQYASEISGSKVWRLVE